MNVFRFSILGVLFVAAVSLISCDEDQEDVSPNDAVLGPIRPAEPLPTVKP